MKLLNSVLSATTQWIVGHKTTLAVWAIIFIALFVWISMGRSQHDAIIGKLSSSDPTVRDAEVLDLARNGQLASTLLSTEDPTGDATTPQNVASAQIRTQAGDSLLRVLDKLTASQAFAALFSMQKDAVTAPDSVTGLSELGAINESNLNVLVTGLGDGDPDVRTASVAALSKIGGSHVAKLVAMQVTVDTAQDSALATLAALGKPAVPYVIALLQNPRTTETLKEDAATTLGTIGDPSGSIALETAANSNPPIAELRRVCLTSLAEIVLTTIPAPSTIAAAGVAPPSAQDTASAYAETPVLIASLLNGNDDSFARTREALALGRLSTTAATGALVKSLGSLDLRIAVAAQTGVESAGQKAVPQLAAVLRDRSQQVRIAAATALGVIGTDDSIRALTPAFSDSMPEVRCAAAQGLGRGNNPAAIPILMAQLGDPDGSVASAVSYSLHELGAPAVSQLIEALAESSTNSNEPYYASQALIADGDNALPALITASSSSASSQKVWIAVTLGAMHDPKTIPTLQSLAADSDPNVKWAAGQALEQYEGEG